jgi:hypothetical protein
MHNAKNVQTRKFLFYEIILIGYIFIGPKIRGQYETFWTTTVYFIKHRILIIDNPTALSGTIQRQHDDSCSAGACIADVPGLPAQLRVLSIVAIGYADESKAPHPGKTLAWVRVVFNNCATAYPHMR